VLDLLGQLVDKSLVLAEAAESPVRYRMLETVRQYALERLVDSREFEELNQQLAAYMTNFAESAKSGLFGPQQLSGPSGRRACTCGKDRTGWSRCLSCPHARTHSRRCVHARYSG
jgi:hypothetical protein